MTLVHLRLRRGEAIAEERLIDGAALYFCAKDACPHYRGQLGLLAGAEAMLCGLVQHPPDRICQPFYLEQAEDLDKLRRQSWQQRLDDAEAFESAIAAASATTPESGESCSLSPIPGGEGWGEGGRGQTEGQGEGERDQTGRGVRAAGVVPSPPSLGERARERGDGIKPRGEGINVP